MVGSPATAGGSEEVHYAGWNDHLALPAKAVRDRLLGGFGVSVGSRIIEESGWRLKKAGSLIKLLARDHVRYPN